MAAAAPPLFDLDASAQTEIVALQMFDGDFLRRTAGLLNPAYFGDEVEAGFVSIANTFFQTYHEAPSPIAWRELVKDAFKAKPAIWRDDMKLDVVTKLGECASMTIRSKGFLLDKIEEFAQQQEIMNALIDSAASMGRLAGGARFKFVQDRMTKAFKVGLREGDTDYDYFAELQNRTDERLLIASGGRPKTGITTGIKELDAILMHGGWGRGEMSLFMGPAKAGKSFFLTFCASSAVLMGYNVLFVTLENSTLIQAQRMDAFFSDIDMGEHLKSPHTLHGVVDSIGKGGKVGALKIREFPTGVFKPNDLEILLEEYQTKGVDFDMIVVDYLDIQAPDKAKDSEREASKDVYTRMRGIVGTYMTSRGKAALLSATQTNREGAKAAIAHMTQVAEDFNKIRIADLVVGINRTEEEKKNHKARLNLVASRNQSDGPTLFIRQELGKGKAVAEVESIE